MHIMEATVDVINNGNTHNAILFNNFTGENASFFITSIEDNGDTSVTLNLIVIVDSLAASDCKIAGTVINELVVTDARVVNTADYVPKTVKDVERVAKFAYSHGYKFGVDDVLEKDNNDALYTRRRRMLTEYPDGYFRVYPKPNFGR